MVDADDLSIVYSDWSMVYSGRPRIDTDSDRLMVYSDGRSMFGDFYRSMVDVDDLSMVDSDQSMVDADDRPLLLVNDQSEVDQLVVDDRSRLHVKSAGWQQ